jgi:hypothetical protein
MSTIAAISEFIPTVVAANAFKQLENRIGVTNFVNTDFSNEIASYGDVVKVPFYGTGGTARTKAAGSDFVSDTATMTSTPINLNQTPYKELPVDKNQMGSSRVKDLLNGLSLTCIQSVLEQIDTQVFSLASSLTNQFDESSNHYADIVKAQRTLFANKAPDDANYVYAVTPTKFEDLATDDAISKMLNFGGDVARTGNLPMVSGVPIWRTQLIQSGGSPVKKQNIVMHRDAIGVAFRPMMAVSSGSVLKQEVYNDPRTKISILLSVGFREKENNFFVRAEALYGLSILRDELAVVIKEA